MKWVLVGIIIACSACSDIMSTIGMRHHGKVTDLAPRGIAHLLHYIVASRYILIAIAAMAVSFFALMSLLALAEVSFAIPATSASVLLETVLAKIILREQVHWQRWLGAFVVAAGVALLALP